MERLGAFLVCVAVAAGCLSNTNSSPNGHPTADEPQASTSQASVVPDPTSSAPTGPPAPDGGNVTWDDLHAHRVAFSTPPGQWALVRFHLATAATNSDPMNKTYAVRYALAVDAQGAEAAFQFVGFAWGDLPKPVLQPVWNSTYVTGRASGNCGSMGCGPWYVVLVGSHSGVVHVSFALLTDTDPSDKETVLSRPVRPVAIDRQGATAVFAYARQSVDAAGAATWTTVGPISHTATAGAGPASEHEMTVVNATLQNAVNGTLFLHYHPGGQGQVDETYVLRMGRVTAADKEYGQAGQNPPDWDLNALTPRGLTKIRFSQNVTGTQTNGVSTFSVGGIEASYAWIDADLSATPWCCGFLDARGG